MFTRISAHNVTVFPLHQLPVPLAKDESERSETKFKSIQVDREIFRSARDHCEGGPDRSSFADQSYASKAADMNVELNKTKYTQTSPKKITE